ncbi:nickel-responsive transcriptional regulator NikR [Magnetospirillum fulvum]|uniref:Putative nickel-responsive regulator n=1 Tax=Magnetospirillum fulvum TaxID=1082 RepID=A0A1H6HMU1_MAGFU|nr:nickel-responsive transcriptional regulator NikR [Magnetospirillum fulvum]SEH35293.1 transcriptional regulator, CopG family [Magnetospirillum fulvum]
MDRFTVSLDEELLTEFDAFLRRKSYSNRSEAVRDILRDRLDADRLERTKAAADAAPFCIASLSYLYDHHTRELARRLTTAQHRHHDLTLSTLHVHLDHETCLEVVILRGPTEAVQDCADGILAETGVRHGKLHLVPVEHDPTDGHHHHHDHDHRHEPT